MLHISEAVSGLSSGCVCPACGTALVAYKGKRKQHHFGHHADRACSGAMETALHEFAKQVLADNRTLMLPPLIARFGDIEDLIRTSQEFAYDAVEVEKAMPNMRPDVTVRRGEAVLLIEVAVRHPCEDTKLALIRERRLPAIEIDLSRIRHDAPPQEHADAVLRSAPRHWLFNRFIEEAEADLRQRAAAQASALKARQDKQWGKLATDLAAAYQTQQLTDDRGWLEPIQDADLEQYVGNAIFGEGCFLASAVVWQSALLHNLVLGTGQHGDLAPFSAAEWLVEKGFLKPAFRTVPVQGASEMKAYLAAAVPGFRPIINVVEEFMTGLARQGLLYKGRTGWSSGTPKAVEARREREAMKAARNRWTELQEEISAIKDAALRGTDIDFAAWAKKSHDGLNGTPEDIVFQGGFRFDDLKRHLVFLRQSLKPGAYAASRNLLGLPLEEDQDARRREDQERREVWRQEQERREQIAVERRRSETRAFLVGLRANATALLGDETGDAWVSKQLPDEAAKPEGLELQANQMVDLRRALEAEGCRIEAAAHAKVVAAALALRCLDQLREKAARDPELSTSDRLDAWMRGSRPGLGGARPKDFCVDQYTLDRCLAELPSRMAKNGRGRNR
jgi:hypothetical protein